MFHLSYFIFHLFPVQVPIKARPIYDDKLAMFGNESFIISPLPHQREGPGEGGWGFIFPQTLN